MALQSLRRYLTQTELEDRVSVDTFDNTRLIRAEQDIDNAIASFYEGGYKKALSNERIYEDSVFDGITVTISDFSPANGYYDRTVVEILSGSNSGSRFAVKSQDNNILALWETSGITETVVAKLYQYGKAPFAKDLRSKGNRYYKTIDENIKESVALQYLYRQINGDAIGSNYPVVEYNVSQDKYSEKFDTKTMSGHIDRIHPDAYELIKHLTTQSL